MWPQENKPASAVALFLLKKGRFSIFGLKILKKLIFQIGFLEALSQKGVYCARCAIFGIFCDYPVAQGQKSIFGLKIMEKIDFFILVFAKRFQYQKHAFGRISIRISISPRF